MATTTPNLGLILPGYTDIADVEVLDTNFSDIDTQVERQARRNVANGYPGLDASGNVIEHGKALSTVYGLVETTTAVTANASAVYGEVVLANASAGAISVILPSAATANSRITVKKTDTSGNAVTVTPSSGTVDTLASYVITGAMNSADFVSDGTNWWVI